jgi:excisionase family DNA binding protein
MPDDREKLVSVKDLAERHSMKASWFYQAAERGDIPSYKIGKYRRFRLSEVERWLETRRNGN